jgi:hypothetical protein
MILSEEEEMAEGPVPQRLVENLDLEKRQKNGNGSTTSFGTDLVTAVWKVMLAGYHRR